MRSRSMVLSSAAILIAAVACSSKSTAPKPTVAGTWHVSFGALQGGTLTPTSFDAVVSAQGNSYVVSMPAITWSVGPVVFDSAFVSTFSNSTTFGFAATVHATNRTQACELVQFAGTRNASRDTLQSAQVALFLGDTVAGGYCQASAGGGATITK